MDIQEAWEKALGNTEIIRSRVKELMTFADTQVPYIFLSESLPDPQKTIVRRGQIVVEKPSIILPPHLPQFQGFEFEETLEVSREALTNFLLVRGVALPSLKYSNLTYSQDLMERRLNDTIKEISEGLQEKEDVQTGLVAGPEDCWQLSLLIFVCSQVVKNAEVDIKRLLDEHKKRKEN